LIRELPRGPFGLFLHAHYRRVPGVLSRAVMGCGAIFMVQRVRSQSDSLMDHGAIAETDPLLLAEMVALVLEQGLDVVPLVEVGRRLASRQTERRFVSFTFDGAYRATLANVMPLFRRSGLPFTLYVNADFLDSGRVPWWMALEALVAKSDALRLTRDGKVQNHPCATRAEKRTCFNDLFRELMRMPGAHRAAHIELLCRNHKIGLAGIAARELANSAELQALAKDPLVTIGGQPGGARVLSELSDDEAREAMSASLEALEAALGSRPRHIAYPGSHASSVGAREFKLAAELGIQTAVTAVEGALWPEHAGELFALPRIALNNDPATLVRALMLGSGASFTAGASAAGRQIA
jgi:peptidoglycan/xylan/chitin deacetylase (PgdA/CDA1 family)